MSVEPRSRAYHADFVSWIDRQAEALRSHQAEGLDWDIDEHELPGQPIWSAETVVHQDFLP